MRRKISASLAALAVGLAAGSSVEAVAQAAPGTSAPASAGAPASAQVPADPSRWTPNDPASSPGAQPLPSVPVPVVDKRPNVLIWMIDDVGFGQLSSFGGLVPTPNIDRVARMGLRYDNYRTAAMCSPSRASMLTGRMPHTVHIGGHANQAFPAPGYDGHVPPEAGTIAENLRQGGYATFAVGKWDHFPPAEASPAGPNTRWPIQQGFDRFYGFLSADTDNFFPTLTRDNTPIPAPLSPTYHLSADMADQAIAMMRSRGSGPGTKPFFMYWATGAAHSPHHAPQEWLDRFKGKFDMGWDKAREMILAREIKAGVMPKGTKLSPRPKEVPAWNTLNADQKRLYAREMEAFAASLAYADAQFGRILDDLQERGELDNTMVVIATDNGASAEGGPDGVLTESYLGNATPPTFADNMAMIDKWGTSATYPHYNIGWAVAGDTPFPFWKQTTFDGGIHVPLLVSWPKGIASRGEVRHQSVHVSDIAPTILAATTVPLAPMVNNVKQSAMDGVSFAPSFTTTGDRRQGRAQYSELYGNKALWQDGWTIVTNHRINTWRPDAVTGKPFNDPWQLYNSAIDPGQTTDLSQKDPKRVAAMASVWDEQATRYNVLPQHNSGDERPMRIATFMATMKANGGKWHYDGPVSNIYFGREPPINLMPFTMTAKVTLAQPGVTGPIFAFGGIVPGMALYLDQGRPVFLFNEMTSTRHRIEGAGVLHTGENTVTLGIRQASKPDAAGKADWAISVGANGSPLSTQTLHVEMPQFMGLSATFDIGNDVGSAVMEGYRPGQPLNAKIEDVTFDFVSK